MTPLERQKEFHKELKDLLRKYKAEIMIEDFGRNYVSDNKLVVDFDYDESFFEEHNTGIIPQLILGTYEDGSA